MKKQLAFSIGMFISYIFIGAYLGIHDNISYLTIILQLIFAAIMSVLFYRTRHAAIVPITSIVLFFAIGYLTIKWIKHSTFDNFSFTAFLFFLMLTIFAVMSDKIKQNDTFGIRTPFTMEYESVWMKTHDFLAVILFLFIPSAFSVIFWFSSWLRFALTCAFVLLPLLIATIYSTVIGLPYHKEQKEKENRELHAQEKLEEEGKI